MDRSAAPRRVALVDLDWREADVMLDLLRAPDLTVALVLGASARDPGPRLAELLGLPRAHEPADLAREILDLALVGSGSPRRDRIERLLAALGTEVLSPAEFARGAP